MDGAGASLGCSTFPGAFPRGAWSVASGGLDTRISRNRVQLGRGGRGVQGGPLGLGSQGLAVWVRRGARRLS